MVAHGERLPKSLGDPLGYPDRLGGVYHVLKQHGELVPPKARKDVFGTHLIVDTLGDRDE
jgi:hypothetical protein